MSQTAIIFPGQGAQTVGMGRDVAAVSQAARDVFAQADDLLHSDLSKRCFEGPADRLNATDVSQPAIFVTSVAIWRALEERGQCRTWDIRATAGLSLGEYTALHVAGRLGFEDGLKLVAERGRLMQAAAEASAGGMVSVMGLDEAAVRKLCEEAAGDDVLVPANFNCPGQIVISGASVACERAVALAEKYGARAVPLTVAGAFHSPLMAPAVAGLRTALEAVEIRQGRFPVVSNVSADYHADSDGVRDLLRRQVAQPIRWQASIERLIAEGCERFVEVGPGRVLTGLMRKINRGVTARNYSAAAALEQVPT
ncbi:MAG: ACP S-malonyltransferase [Phycisphaerae bacterium]